MPDIPNTDNGDVAALAIAWDIVKYSYGVTRNTFGGKGDEGAKELANAVIKAFVAIKNGEPIK
jgi:hypothetical protein